jgi:DNA-binding transcriptional MocR family regulator
VPGQYQIAGETANAIAASIERAITAGVLEPGAPLPSVRRLALDLGVSPATVSGAVADLRRRGLVVSRPRSGTHVAERSAVRRARMPAPIPPGARDLAGGNPDPDLLPDLGGALRELDVPARLYGAPPVLDELAEVAGADLARDGVPVERVAVVNGALDGIERVLAARLASGDAVAVEDPGWPNVFDVARALGLRLVPVAVDDRGMLPGALAGALRAGARAVVITPRGHNPAGAALDAARAEELRAVLTPDVLVLEDDHLGPVAGSPWQSVGPSRPAASHPHTIGPGAAPERRPIGPGRQAWAVVRSASKWLGPDLRVAVVAGDELTLSRVEGRQSLGPGWVSGISQALAASLWSDPEVAALTRRAVETYARRREALSAALASHGIEARARSGINLWIEVPDEDAAVRGLLVDGWAAAAGAPFRLEAGPAVRITTAALEESDAERVATALARAVRPRLRTRAA